MAILIIASTLLMAGQPAAVKAAPDFSGLLSAPENAIQSCKFMRRPDGVHLIITKAKHSEGDAIHIEFSNNKSYVAYDYIFSVSGTKKRKFNVTSSALNKIDQIDIPLRTAIGFNDNRVEPIFIKNGEYTIYIGYNFRSSDESQIYGACSVRLGTK